MIKYKPLTEPLIKELEAIVGLENISRRLEDLICGSYESFLLKYKPEIIVTPENAEQVSKILQLANKYRIPVTPRGAGTSVAGNSLPILGGICLDTHKMNKILELDLENQTVVVEPGVVCDTLNDYLASYGFFFPPDPASSSGATIGGMIANNSGGNRALKYGVTRDHVLWLEAVLATGEIIKTGSKTIKSVSSYDLTRLLIGSEGTLAVITKIGLKITPLPEAYSVALYIFKDIEDAAKAAVKIKSSGVTPAMLEFMDETTSKASFEYAGLSLPKGYTVLVGCDGYKEAVEKEIEVIHSIALKANPIFAVKAGSSEERDRYISARKAALPALSRISPTVCMEDLTVPVTNIPEACKKIAEIPFKLKTPGFNISIFGHIGEGNLHPTFLFNEKESNQRKAFFKALNLLYKEVVIPLNGSVTGEHGIGILRGNFIKLEHGEKTLNLMHEIKKVFDPNMILNPYKGKGGPWPLPKEIGGEIFEE
ncbi:FAD-binding protein [Candidatus Bathyarchaeota archaeon]|nr:FAD-binding protein [Candidatus Bathyarchaeota archaeon]